MQRRHEAPLPREAEAYVLPSTGWLSGPVAVSGIAAPLVAATATTQRISRFWLEALLLKERICERITSRSPCLCRSLQVTLLPVLTRIPAAQMQAWPLGEHVHYSAILRLHPSDLDCMAPRCRRIRTGCCVCGAERTRRPREDGGGAARQAAAKGVEGVRKVESQLRRPATGEFPPLQSPDGCMSCSSSGSPGEWLKRFAPDVPSRHTLSP